LSSEQLRARVDRLADQGFRGVTISYDVWPDAAGLRRLASLSSQAIRTPFALASARCSATTNI
jgi:hypothetical protein